MANETHRVKESDKARIKCQRQGCEARADICEHVGGGFYYYCDSCFAEQTRERERREAYRAESARANTELRIINALQVVKDAILEADADGLPAWGHFRALRDEMVNAGIVSR